MYPTIQRKDIKIEDIPLVAFRPQDQEVKSTVIHYHGWSSNVTYYEPLGQIYALNGYQMVLVEMPGHGLRGSQDYDSFAMAPATVLETVEEYQKIKDQALEEFDIEDYYISGHSLGGIISACLVNQDPQIKGQIVYNSIYDYGAVHHSIDPNMVQDLIEKNPRIIEESKAIADMIALDRLDMIDSLFMVGQADDVISPKLMEDLEAKLEDENKTNRASFIYYDDAGHGISYKMVKDGLDFLEEIA